LFEELMADVLRSHGYSIDRIPNVNYAVMEIDIDGRQTITGLPLYAECKCYETEVDSPKLQAFYGKYTARWFKDKRCHGLFIALPGVNSHAKGFYRENCEGNEQIVMRLLEEEQVLDAIYRSGKVVQPGRIASLVNPNVGSAGDRLLFFTDRSYFWIQYLIPQGGSIPKSVLIADATGRQITEKSTIDYLVSLYPELQDFPPVIAETLPISLGRGPTRESEEIVEVRGSSACFEYQFPASPQFFVGREEVLSEVEELTAAILSKTTSSRGLLFEANSGWGKSSLVLACIDRLTNAGHFALAIDSRSASSSQFVLRVLNYVCSKFGDFGGAIEPGVALGPIAGYEGALETLAGIGAALEKQGKLLFIFFDQFENMFVLKDALRHVRDLFLKICDRQVNVVFGFSWKTDLVGLTNEFPYQLRDALSSACRRIPLEPFSEPETNAMFQRLSKEIKAKLREDLKFFLSEFSQGYPWLLKKLCAHVKSQRDKNVPQLEMVDSLLNVEELFRDDLRGLSPGEEEVLRKIAKVAPIGVSELREEMESAVIQSLLNARLLVRIGTKLDIYWDIFRDYLNTQKIPVQENYLLRLQPTPVLRAANALVEAGRQIPPGAFQSILGASDGSFYNITREMRLLGLASKAGTSIAANPKLPDAGETFEADMRSLIKERLNRNRIVTKLLKELESRTPLSVEDVANIISESCPYIAAKPETWRVYARTIGNWMNFADLAIFRGKTGQLARYRPDRAIREAYLSSARRSYGLRFPRIQYGPIERAAIVVFEAIRSKQRVDWSGFKKSTISKALDTLEDFAFVTRDDQSLEVNARLIDFVADPEHRPELFLHAATRIPAFATFLEALRSRPPESWTSEDLSKEVAHRLNVDWKPGTAATNVKIMLDWARHCGLNTKLKRKRQLGGHRESLDLFEGGRPLERPS
jgi:DNA polymerase III delta prime subunit